MGSEKMDRLRASLSEYLGSFRSVPRGHLVRLAANTNLNAIVTICVSLTTCVVLFGSVPTTLVVGWGTVQVVLSSIILIRQRRAKPDLLKRISPLTPNSRGLHRAIFWAGVSGCLWGSLMGFAPNLPPYDQMIIVLVLCGMASGASATLAAVPSVATTFMAGCTVPVFAYFTFQGGSGSQEMAVIVAIFAVAMINTSRMVSRIVVERQDLETRTELLNLAHLRQTVAAETNLSETLEQAADTCLHTTCSGLGWRAGIVSLQESEGDQGPLHHQYVVGPRKSDLARYLDAAGILFSARATKRILESQTTQWLPIEEVLGPSASAAESTMPPEIKSIVAGPVLIGKDIVAVTTFLCPEETKPEESVLETVTAVGTHLGRAIERHRIREERRKRTKMESLGHLTGSVAHDFNNILAAITGNLEVLQNSLPKSALSDEDWPQAAVSAALNSAERGSNITNSLLLFAHKRQLRPEPANANVLLNDAITRMQTILTENVMLETKLPAALWNVMVDESELNRALSHLLLNACDAMPSGGTVTVTAANHIQQPEQRTDQRIAPGRYVSVGLTDTGTGIATEVRPHIFEPFYTTKEVDKGTGLGLSSVLGFAELSNGGVTVSSQSGIGTKVEILLPATDAEVIYAVEPSETRTPSRPDGKHRALVVEDEPDVANFVREVLTGEGFEVTIAEDGEQAIHALGEAANFDLLLSDVVLPKSLSGVDVVTRYLELRPDGCSLLTSGFTREALEDNRTLPDHVELLQKPYRIAELLSAINKSMARTNKPTDEQLDTPKDATG